MGTPCGHRPDLFERLNTLCGRGVPAVTGVLLQLVSHLTSQHILYLMCSYGCILCAFLLLKAGLGLILEACVMCVIGLREHAVRLLVVWPHCVFSVWVGYPTCTGG